MGEKKSDSSSLIQQAAMSEGSQREAMMGTSPTGSRRIAHVPAGKQKPTPVNSIVNANLAMKQKPNLSKLIGQEKVYIKSNSSQMMNDRQFG